MPAVNRYYSSVAIDTTLKFTITSTATTFVVDSTSGFPTSYPYTLAIGYNTGSEELVTVIGASGTTLTVGTTVAGGANVAGRGIDGTNDQAHTAGEAVKHVISARDMTEAQAHIAAESAVHGITGSFVGTTDTQTLTNKTITGGTVNPTTLQQGSVPVVTTTGTQTLTGKTVNLTSNTLTGTIAQFNTAVSDADLATIAGAETLTNKTLTSPTVNAATLTGTISSASGTIAFGTNASAITANSTTISATEIGYLDGVTSNVQTQLAAKAPLASPTFTGTVTIPAGASISGFAPLASPTFTGTVTLPTSGNGLSPIGVLAPFAGASAPTGWLLCDGSAVSRTTYASLFTVTSTTYGVGDGTTTFNLPDLRGRVIAGKDDMGGTAATRLTTAVSGVNGISLGASGGNQNVHLHTHTFTGTAANTGEDAPDHAHAINAYTTGNEAANYGLSTSSTGFRDRVLVQTTGGQGSNGTTRHIHSLTATGSNGNFGSGSSQNVQPTIILNYIIKY